jgi:hypothetical protein
VIAAAAKALFLKLLVVAAMITVISMMAAVAGVSI